MASWIDQFLSAIGHHSGDADPPMESSETVGESPLSPDGGPATTVFCGTAQDWNRHLAVPWNQRCSGTLHIATEVDHEHHSITFHPANEDSAPAARHLNRGFRILGDVLAPKPHVRALLDQSLFGSGSISTCIRTCDLLPSWSSRELLYGTNLQVEENRILVRTTIFNEVIGNCSKKNRDDTDFLGVAWPLIEALLLQLLQPKYPRDRFIERIDVTAIWAMVNLHVLFDGKKSGRLSPNPTGKVFQKWMAAHQGIDPDELATRSTFFKLLGDLSFLLNDRAVDSLLPTAKVVVRDYLDALYLRLGIAGIMPMTPPWLQSMPYKWKSTRSIRTPKPEIGHYGIIDDEDLNAWKELREPMQDCGYLLIGQLGMGQFGRVYEALNVGNGSFPGRVAIKVDRIRKGHQKEAIEAAETIMQTARGLSASPHVIRIFDAGKLRKRRLTYHVLQLVRGDTLDHLLGIAGMEHASIMRPLSKRTSKDDVSSEFLSALSGTKGEAWRKARRSSRFRRAPDLGELLDLLTSKLLWVEEVHSLGYAVNDLKNGNVMISRRGQFKGIDLDSYSPIFSPLDKMPDFFFLGVAAFQLVTCTSTWYKEANSAEIQALITHIPSLKEHLRKNWPYGDLSEISGGRVSNDEIIDYIGDFVEHARSGVYSEESDRFSEAIDRLIWIKRQLAGAEFILE